MKLNALRVTFRSACTRPLAGLALAMLVALASLARAGEIHCQVADPGVEVGLAALREHLQEVPFSAFDYYVGDAATDAAGPLTDAAALAPEWFSIRPFTHHQRAALAIQAPTTTGLTLGLLRLVRNGLAHPAEYGRQPLRMRPAMPIREMYEEHGWDEPQALESYKSKLRVYLREGFNCVDIPFGWFIPPVEDVKDRAAYLKKWQPHFQTVRAVIEYAHSLGIQVYLVENPQFNPYFSVQESEIRPECLVPPMKTRMAVGSDLSLLLCPSRPENQELIRRNRTMLYREFPKADGIVVYFNDPGGCLCPACTDWGATILRVCHSFYEPLLAELAPQYKLRLSLWGTARDASRKVANGLASASRVIADVQFSPTSPAPPYLMTDPIMIESLAKASQYRPIILQQFYDGVGYKNGWVNMIEHPMPRLMEQNLRQSMAKGKLTGTYGSAFEFNDQQIDARLSGEWGWNPQRSAEEILIEMGDERFGLGAGIPYAKAVQAFENYWDLACIQFFSDGEAEDSAGAARAAQQAVDALQQAAPHVRRDHAFFDGLSALARAMHLTTRQIAQRARAAELIAQHQPAPALAQLRAAQTDADEITRLLSTGYFAYMPKLGWWGQDWVIGRRRAIIEAEIALADPQRWRPAPAPSGDFVRGHWEGASPGTGKVSFTMTPAGAQAELDNTAPAVEWTGAVSSPAPLPAQATLRVDCEVRWLAAKGNTNALLAQWVEDGGFGEGTRSYLKAPADGPWHPVSVSCITPSVKAAASMRLRFLLIGAGPHVQVRHVVISTAKPAEPAAAAK